MRRRTRALSPLLLVTLAACSASPDPSSSGATAGDAGAADAGPAPTGAPSAPGARSARVVEAARVTLPELANGTARVEDPQSG
ncbi:MAG: hypothetical protein FJ104_02315, partial [Deltaproteobacteria bacterium]|nr:hypothetical protein [Deltaproteobacteria bacterium]